MDRAPLPPLLLMRRAGHPATVPDGEVPGGYLDLGALLGNLVRAHVPADRLQAGCRVLDFGCGAGRVLRHFAPEAERGLELWGCDIYEPSIAWARANLPQFNWLTTGEVPPLEAPDEYFDVVYAMSVFTHITTSWTAWLLELHRVLRPGGLLIATFLGRGMYEQLLGERYDDAKVGMLVSQPDAPWEDGGPSVFHSYWWLRAHWSPAFKILKIEDPGRIFGRSIGQGVLVGQRTVMPPTPERLIAPDAGEPREATAALHNVQRLSRELRNRREGDGR